MISLAPCSSIKGPPVIPPLRLQERSATDEGEGEFPLFLLVREEKEPREVANNQRLVFQMRFTSHGDENRCRITLTDTFEDRRVNKYRKCVFLPPGPVERNSTFLLPPGCKTMGDGLPCGCGISRGLSPSRFCSGPSRVLPTSHSPLNFRCASCRAQECNPLCFLLQR
jgi:hypothetical protein